MHAKLINENGKIKNVKVGFSWTTFFFGFLVPLVRLDFFYFIIFGIIDVLLAAFTFGIGAFIFDIIVCFLYNKWYARRLMGRKGYRPLSEADEAILRSKNYI